MVTVGTDNPFESVLIVEGDPEDLDANPAAGQRRLAVDSTDHLLYLVDDTGTKTVVGSSSGLTDPMTTRGDLIIRNASNVTARLGRGSASQVLTSDGTDLAWATPAASAVTGTKMYFAGLPSGTLTRSYTFTSTTESWTNNVGTMTSTSSRLQLTHTSPARAIEPSGAANVADGEVECDWYTTAMTGSAGLGFRATDDANMYLLIFQPAVVATFYKMVGGTTTAIKASDRSAANIAVAGPYHLLIRFVGTWIECYVNGTLFVQVADATYSTGRVGLRVDNATCQIDNLNIYSSPVRTGNVVVA